jgi:outer membrane protein assembly factor BamB
MARKVTMQSKENSCPLSAPLLLAAVLSGSATVHAGDWPQILGPGRNGVAVDERLVDSFPKKGPPIVWEHGVGEGYAGVAVADGLVVIFHRLSDEEVVEGLEAVTGKPVWKQAFSATYERGINPDRGPRCVPLIHKGNVYLCGAAGDLHSVVLKTGKKRWSRALASDYSIPQSYFGVGSTPIVEDDKLLVNVGAKQGAGIVAFGLADGKTVWKATDEQASYSSPTAVTLDGVRQVIFVTRLNALSIDPDNGHVRWKFRFGIPGPTVNAATPQVLDGDLFLSASYGLGAVCRKIGKASAEPVWANDETMSSQFSTSVPHEGFLYGVDGRQDIPPARLRCFDPKTGKVQWSEENFPVANLIAADGKLVIVTDNGNLILGAASPRSYRELGRTKLAGDETRALPALANGLLYARDRKTLKCVDLRPTK